MLPILGLNYKDKGDEAQRWLKQFGDPYQLSVVDADGRIGIDYGVYGVPETYLIDARGRDPLQADRPAHRGDPGAEGPAARDGAEEMRALFSHRFPFFNCFERKSNRKQ